MSEYLLDRILGLQRNERITEDALARMLKEAVQTSYRRGGEENSLTGNVKKQTVKNKIHGLKFPKNEEKPKKKKEVDYLYIEADVDHASLRFREKKGDLTENENHQKNNCLIPKLVYVYEGIEKEAPKSKRHKLINPYERLHLAVDWVREQIERKTVYDYALSESTLEDVYVKLTTTKVGQVHDLNHAI